MGLGSVTEVTHDGIACLFALDFQEFVVSLNADLKAIDVSASDRERVGDVHVAVLLARPDFTHQALVWIEIEISRHPPAHRHTSHHINRIDARLECDRTEPNRLPERQPRSRPHPHCDAAWMEWFIGKRFVLPDDEFDQTPLYFLVGHPPAAFFDTHGVTFFLFFSSSDFGATSIASRRRSTKLMITIAFILTKCKYLCYNKKIALRES